MDPRPRDDAVQDIARDLGQVASQIPTFKGEADAYLSDPNYNTLRLRLKNAHAAAFFGVPTLALPLCRRSFAPKARFAGKGVESKVAPAVLVAPRGPDHRG
jgi:hypothetical protein